MLSRYLVPLLAMSAIAACSGPEPGVTSPLMVPLTGGPAPAYSSAPCTFTVAGTTMSLDADCSTDATILIPDGFTLDGAFHTITAVDPAGDHFRGAVVANGGSSAWVTRLEVSAMGLANVCDGGGDRLRGIMFEGASGAITHSLVDGINQGASGCQEGNAVEVRDFDGGPEASVVEMAHNTLTNWQKTGIVCNGDSRCSIHHNTIGASATQANLAANSVQFGFGAGGSLENNKVAGNSWCGPSDFVATAVLLFVPAATLVESNWIDGNADVGIYGFGDGVTIAKNKVYDVGPDCNAFGYDIGIGDYGTGNVVTKNHVSGFDTPFDGVTGPKNKVKKAHGSPF